MRRSWETWATRRLRRLSWSFQLTQLILNPDCHLLEVYTEAVDFISQHSAGSGINGSAEVALMKTVHQHRKAMRAAGQQAKISSPAIGPKPRLAATDQPLRRRKKLSWPFVCCFKLLAAQNHIKITFQDASVTAPGLPRSLLPVMAAWIVAQQRQFPACLMNSFIGSSETRFRLTFPGSAE